MATNVDALLPGPWRALVTFEPVPDLHEGPRSFKEHLPDINSRLVQALALHVFSRSLMRISAEAPRTSCSYLELPGRVISILLSLHTIALF